MPQPFIAEIRPFAFGTAPDGWLPCDGRVLQVSANAELFSLISNIYGGDGVQNFALPNLQGRVPLHPGAGEGRTVYKLGDAGGSTTVTVTLDQLPVHTHALQASVDPANLDDPAPTNALARSAGGNAYIPYDANSLTVLAGTAIVQGGGGDQPHNNMMPYLAIGYYIAVAGIFPPHPS